MAVKRMTIWLDENLAQNMDLLKEKEDMKNQSDFISRAVEFYSGYLFSKNSTKYISDILIGEMEGIVKSTEQRLSRLLLSSAINSETMIQMYAHETDWTADQIAYVKQESIKSITKRGE